MGAYFDVNELGMDGIYLKSFEEYPILT